MTIRSDEITRVLMERLEGFHLSGETQEVGAVLQVGDGMARLDGLTNAMAGELLLFPNDLAGMALNLERECVGAALLGDGALVREGDPVRRSGRVIDVPVGEGLLGRVVDALGRPVDGKGPVPGDRRRPVEAVAPGVVERQPVREPLQTGLKAVDAMIPIGRGQRELIIGDRQTGKTAIAVDTILRQKNEPDRPVCIYVAVGQKQSTVAQVARTLFEHGAMDYTVVVNASSADPAPLQFIAPYAGCAMGEEFMWAGRAVLIVYDDLSKHASAYRQMSLLLRRPPGREAFPGDVFYLHSRLLERACKLSDKNGGGSITALPVVETQANDVSAYIPTNIISITDGQIYLESTLFHSGVRPAVNVGLSVSRVGGSAQAKAMKQVAGKLRLDLAQYNELAAFAQFGSDLDKTSQAQLARGRRLVEVLKQEQYCPLSMAQQVAILHAATNGELDDVPVDDVRRFERGYLNWLGRERAPLLETVTQSRVLSDDTHAALTGAVQSFKSVFRS